MSELDGYLACLKTMREETQDVNEAVALDTAVQAVALLESIMGSADLCGAVEQQLGEDIWPT